MSGAEELPVRRAADLDAQDDVEEWLVHTLWLAEAVGITGGAPKSAKTWYALDLAISVASGTPCLDRFAVEQPGTALIFLAEDAEKQVRARIEAICAHRGIDIESLHVQVITAAELRLDLQRDRDRLERTIERIKPRLLVLDPLVRLHRADENSAQDMSALLGHLRVLQRRYHVAILLVHHASKKHRSRPGQALRGSSDLHAFGDSMAYLARNDDHLVLTLEHRAAPEPDPLRLRLVSRPDGSATHLEVVASIVADGKTDPIALESALLQILGSQRRPMHRTALRKALRVNNQRLGDILEDMQLRKEIVHTRDGWALPTEATQQQIPGEAEADGGDTPAKE